VAGADGNDAIDPIIFRGAVPLAAADPRQDGYRFRGVPSRAQHGAGARHRYAGDFSNFLVRQFVDLALHDGFTEWLGQLRH
jgi:hypothetical protein